MFRIFSLILILLFPGFSAAKSWKSPAAEKRDLYDPLRGPYNGYDVRFMEGNLLYKGYIAHIFPDKPVNMVGWRFFVDANGAGLSGWVLKGAVTPWVEPPETLTGQALQEKLIFESKNGGPLFTNRFGGKGEMSFKQDTYFNTIRSNTPWFYGKGSNAYGALYMTSRDYLPFMIKGDFKRAEFPVTPDGAKPYAWEAAGSLFKNGRKVYDGQWKGFSYSGAGAWYYENGDRYDGYVTGLLPYPRVTGKGVLTRANGEKIAVDFKRSTSLEEAQTGPYPTDMDFKTRDRDGQALLSMGAGAQAANCRILDLDPAQFKKITYEGGCDEAGLAHGVGRVWVERKTAVDLVKNNIPPFVMTTLLTGHFAHGKFRGAGQYAQADGTTSDWNITETLCTFEGLSVNDRNIYFMEGKILISGSDCKKHLLVPSVKWPSSKGMLLGEAAFYDKGLEIGRVSERGGAYQSASVRWPVSFRGTINWGKDPSGKTLYEPTDQTDNFGARLVEGLLPGTKGNSSLETVTEDGHVIRELADPAGFALALIDIVLKDNYESTGGIDTAKILLERLAEARAFAPDDPDVTKYYFKAQNIATTMRDQANEKSKQDLLAEQEALRRFRSEQPSAMDAFNKRMGALRQKQADDQQYENKVNNLSNYRSATDSGRESLQRAQETKDNRELNSH